MQAKWWCWWWFLVTQNNWVFVLFTRSMCRWILKGKDDTPDAVLVYSPPFILYCGVSKSIVTWVCLRGLDSMTCPLKPKWKPILTSRSLKNGWKNNSILKDLFLLIHRLSQVNCIVVHFSPILRNKGFCAPSLARAALEALEALEMAACARNT